MNGTENEQKSSPLNGQGFDSQRKINTKEIKNKASFTNSQNSFLCVLIFLSNLLFLIMHKHCSTISTFEICNSELILNYFISYHVGRNISMITRANVHVPAREVETWLVNEKNNSTHKRQYWINPCLVMILSYLMWKKWGQ